MEIIVKKDSLGYEDCPFRCWIPSIGEYWCNVLESVDIYEDWECKPNRIDFCPLLKYDEITVSWEK